jgi:DNA modification methylase
MLRSEIIQGDARTVLAGMPAGSVQCCITSPPYWSLRDYGVEGQLGLERTPEEYVENMVAVFREVRRVLRDDGTVWLNMGDSYNGQGARAPSIQPNGDMSYRAAGRSIDVPRLKPKDLLGMPWRLAFALQADGWYLRSDIIWAKPNPMPESGRCSPANVHEDGQMANMDRPTKSHEYVFLLTNQPTYFWDAEAVREADKGQDHPRKVLDGQPSLTPPGQPTNRGIRTAEGRDGLGRNIRTIWVIPTQPYPEAHFATFPEKLVERCIRAGTSEKGCCPECGAPWVRIVEKERVATRPGLNNVPDPTGMANRDPGRHVTETTTLGWQPGCECYATYATSGLTRGRPEDPSEWLCGPCTVLDLFAGSGTVGVVCGRENRAFIGIELNPDYVEMAEQRIDKVMRVADMERRQRKFAYGP